jgi:hypothetical protein
LEPISRKIYNESFSREKYAKMLEEIEAEFPGLLDFRIAETPVFVNKELKIKLLKAANEIIKSINTDDFIAKTERAVPAEFYVSNESPRPDCLAIDFAICKNDEGLPEPKLIELQAFPSLFAYQSYLSGKYKKHFEISNKFSPFFNRLNAASYAEEMLKFLLDGLDPKQVILLEIYPENQKTRLDFALTKAFWGIETVCVTKLYTEGNIVFYDKGEEKIQVKRIYNRLIFDDLENLGASNKLKINFKENLDISWVSHPNWFYRISKFCMPYLKSDSVPETKFLSAYVEFPEDLENYVLKPLFSFAGSGVKIEVQKSDLKAIKDPENYILQRKVNYEPLIKDINGEGVKFEIRLLFIWPKNLNAPKLVTNLARLSKGKMIGVAYNKDFEWVGGSSAFFETE